MKDFFEEGKGIRKLAKQLVTSFMKSESDCRSTGPGIKQAQIFKQCGFDWGNHYKATSSNQQYWIVGLLKELETEGLVVQVRVSGPWRLKQ